MNEKAKPTLGLNANIFEIGYKGKNLEIEVSFGIKFQMFDKNGKFDPDFKPFFDIDLVLFNKKNMLGG